VIVDRRFDVSLALQSVVANPIVEKWMSGSRSRSDSKVDTLDFSLLKTLNIYAERTCNFEKVVVRKVERKFEFTSLRHRVFLL
jgi:hypothetical protein